MNVQLTPELEQLVKSKVETGRYNSPNEVMREALRLMEERDLAKAELREKIAVAMKSLRQGEGTDGEEFMDQMIAELDEEIRAENAKAEQELVASQ